MRTRLSLLVVTILVAGVAVACGRASQADIDAALGITPTVTLSAEQMQTSTASAGAAGPAIGDVAKGAVDFRLRCANCHRANSPQGAPLLSGPDNPAVALTNDQLVALVRTGEGHSTPPGPLGEVIISNSALMNIIAYIRDQSK